MHRQSIVRHRTSKNTSEFIFFFGYLLLGVGTQGGPVGESWSRCGPRHHCPFTIWLQSQVLLLSGTFSFLSIRFLEKLPVFKSPSCHQSDCETQVSLQCILTSAKLIMVEILFQQLCISSLCNVQSLTATIYSESRSTYHLIPWC